MTDDHIRVRGAREHNLKGIDVAVPKGALTVVTGVSGSGKSSLVFDTIAAESQRQLGETFTAFARHRLPRYARPDADAIEDLPAAIVVGQKRLGGNARSTVGTATEVYALMRLLWSRAGRPPAGESTAFSFNDPQGMCPRCSGLGTVRTIDLERLVDRRLSLNEGAIRFPTFHVGGWMWRTFAESGHFDPGKPLSDYTPEEWRRFLRGAPDRRRGGSGPSANYEGLLTRFERIWLPKDPESLRGPTREAFEEVVREGTCPACRGARLSEAALSSRIGGRTIAECAAMEIADLLEVVRTIDAPGAEPVVAGLVAHLERLAGIGLGYLSVDRPTTTLSGGESQRVTMVRHLGSSLTGMAYILDEPSAGLHPHDVADLVALLRTLRDKGNTVIVVEHDPDVIRAADHVIDLGPGPGDAGGQILYEGDVAGLAASGTITGDHLDRPTTLKERLRRPAGAIEIREATRHNLQNIDVDIPLGVLTVVTGVAGSGKSTLVHGYVPRLRPDAVVVGQDAVHASRRSTPATYTGVLDPIRDLFAAENGVSPSLFSPNADGGCPRCGGLGAIYTDLAFLEPMVSVCETCDGRRFTDEALRYRFRGRTIGEVFQASAQDLVDVFPEQRVRRVLEHLVDVGLGYLPLGQPLTTLSGGERQRLRLSRELDRPDRVYVFDEPTTGLHMADVADLLALLNRLVDRGGTAVVIEHDVAVMAQADWIIDLGPGPGRHGGRLLFSGTPADLLRTGDSPTAHHLREAVNRPTR
ncbi:ATP-binding cassette domain-containing protein [Actinomadura fibrosa]|uniref:UvrABC system protein A n=1 Tax=Actinomadura fibrosa TaxID=111802 RepID=A0ABW2XU27_9ACTN|nr:excinuclease ABC subunit UvrA [Actinomadura fibrosa]